MLILRLILRESLMVAVIGAALGIPLAYLAARNVRLWTSGGNLPS